MGHDQKGRIMGDVVYFKVSDDPVTDEEAIELINRIARLFMLRVSFHGHEDEDPRFLIKSSADQPAQDDIVTRFTRSELRPIVDGLDGATVGYAIASSVDSLNNALNGID